MSDTTDHMRPRRLRDQTARIAVALAVIVVSTLGAFLQPSPENPRVEIELFSFDSIIHPIETNRLIRAGTDRDSFARAKLFGSPNLDRLWLATPDFTATSADGGRTWRASNLPSTVPHPDPSNGSEERTFELSALAFSGDGRNGLAVGGLEYQILSTENGGETWQLFFSTHPLAADEYAQGFPRHLRAAALSQDGQRGVAVGTLGAILVLGPDGKWLFDH